MHQIDQLNDHLISKPYIHRIELLERFFQILDNKELVFVNPCLWTDPLENIIFNAQLIKKNNEKYDHPAKKDIYAQCWSYDRDSMALWQIYTFKHNNKNEIKRYKGVRISTTITNLKQISELNTGQFYYGLVQYYSKKKLFDLIKDKDFIKGLESLKLGEDHLKTLLVKRRSYQYEKEFRLLAVPDKRHIDKNNLCRLKIEPTKFITAVKFDPQFSEEEFNEIRDKLINQYNFPKSIIISHSSLNKANEFSIKLNV